MNTNVFLLFFSFVFLQIEKEREREWYIKLGIRRNSPKVTYLIFRRDSTGESFFFYGLIDFMLFLTLAWRKRLLRVLQNFFVFFYPEYLAFGSFSYEPCLKTDFLTIYFRWFGVLCGFVVGHCRFWLLWMWVLYLYSSWLIRGPLFREGEDASLRPSVYRILVINCVAVSEQYVVELSRLPHFWGISSSPAAFLFLIFLRTESSSSLVNGPSLMSNCLLIILVIGSCVMFGGLASRFSNCCFHSLILSCWFAAFSFSLAVLFLPLTAYLC